MSVLADSLRQFWLPGLNSVSGKLSKGLQAWLLSQNYQIYVPVTPTSFEVTVTPWADLLAAYAFDCGRMSAAALESMEGVEPHPKLGKASAWMIIRSYYSAFYAIHAIMRMFGVSCTSLDAKHAGAVNQIANLFGFGIPKGISGGLFRCEYVHTTSSMLCTSLATSGGGVHEQTWRVFIGLIKDLRDRLLAPNAVGVTANLQIAAQRLEDVERFLSQGGCNSGNWLSMVRNRTNYNLDFGTWFPYSNQPKYYGQLANVARTTWRADSDNVAFGGVGGRDIQLFLEVCGFLVSLCREMTEDMATRCPQGKSFLNFGAIPFIRAVGQPN